jgi:hypothetical protein
MKKVNEFLESACPNEPIHLGRPPGIVFNGDDPARAKVAHQLTEVESADPTAALDDRRFINALSINEHLRKDFR